MSRSISRTQGQRGALAKHAAACRRHLQHAMVPAMWALSRLWVSWYSACLTDFRLTAAHTDMYELLAIFKKRMYVLPAAVDVHKRVHIDTL